MSIYNAVKRLILYSDVFDALSDATPVAVVPQENCIFGGVIETYDNFRRSNFGFIQGEALLKVEHCLVVRKGTSLADIQRVMSHEQALGQCRLFLKTYLPEAEQVKMPSTASAARALLDNPPNCAAICSKLCASIFSGLDVLKECIQTGNVNYTRFLIITRNRNTTIPARFLVAPCYRALYSIRAGSSNSSDLMDVLKLLSVRVTRVDRRPDVAATTPFQDIYFVEVERIASEPSRDIVAWTIEVDRLVLSVRQAGGDITVIGIW
ncbi:hypothetical protein APHAL10511_006303 [Amanita phalloides]|nr:hypothetical protein APHAL10511_006303 [Amanita phalloides]